MRTVAEDDPIRGYVFSASRDMGMVRRELAGEVLIVVLGLIVCASAVVYSFKGEPIHGLVVVFVLGCAVVCLAFSLIGLTWPKLTRTSVVVDMDRAREFVDGRMVKEFRFGPGVRADAGVNYFIAGSWAPLYGIGFVKDGERIFVSPGEGYRLPLVDRLWPLALAVIRVHGLGLTATFRAHLRYERRRGGYWAGIHDELLGDEDEDPRGFYERYFAELREEAADQEVLADGDHR